MKKKKGRKIIIIKNSHSTDVEYNPNLGKGRLFATKTKNIRKPRIPGMHGALFIRTPKDERIRGMNGWALSLL